MANVLKAVDGQRECTVCKKTKELEKFGFMKKAGFYNSICKACDNERSHKKAAERVAWLDKIKTDAGCADCGYNAYGVALDFDHLPEFEKSFNVSKLVRYGSIDRILDEIAKCEVVCANCHRVRTMKRHRE